MKLKIEHIIILVLIVVILWMRACTERPISQEPIITTTTITNYDTLFSTTPVYVPKYIKRIIHDTLFENIDTNEILKDYFSTYYYEDKIDNDSVKIWINDSISKNKIASRNLSYNIIFKTKTNIITYTLTKPSPQKREFYYGFGLGLTQQGFNYIGAEFMFKPKKPQLIGVGVGINNNLVPAANMKMLWKIGK